jgi:hypothetical protein
MSGGDYMNFWRSVRHHTAREVNEAEYRIVDRAMRSNDPSIISAAIAAVGNPPSLRMLSYKVQRALEKSGKALERSGKALEKSRKKDKESHQGKVLEKTPEKGKETGSWWSRLTSSRRSSRKSSTDPRVKAVQDKVFFSRLWTAVEPYLAGNLNEHKRKELAAAFHTGRASVVLEVLGTLPPNVEGRIISNEISSLYPNAYD